jgi:hypothetical protein
MIVVIGTFGSGLPCESLTGVSSAVSIWKRLASDAKSTVPVRRGDAKTVAWYAAWNVRLVFSACVAPVAFAAVALPPT